jgi:ABC-type phosphonate transport system ATPase subunit
VPSDWPSQGAITFNKYTMRYNDTLPPALKNVTLTIKPKEKIGIVGNSGSGLLPFYFCSKSSVRAECWQGTGITFLGRVV